MVYEFHQDDPKKCTAARLRKFNLARRITSLKQVPSSTIVLNPTARQRITSTDRNIIEQHGIVALDCSWNRSDRVFNMNIPGQSRKLPLLLAGNPTNYSVPGKLSTAEAFAAALFITNFEAEARKILSLFSWGETFLTLNMEPLLAYAKAKPEEMAEIEASFF
jgi:rRNA small subunit aminocarboxypropyltransferase